MLYKQKKKFMNVTGSNGVIANTCCAIMLYTASLMNYTISGTYILMPILLLLRKMDENKEINKYKAINAVVGAAFITALSMFLSVNMACLLLWLDYKGPHSEFNNAYHDINQ